VSDRTFPSAQCVLTLSYLCLTGLSPTLCLLELSPVLCMFVSYGALSGTMFVSYGALSGTISDCGVTSGALSSTNVSTTGLKNLMDATPGHEQPLSQSRDTKHSSYPPFIITY
jgi:hypothetical protein